ncbi:MAG: hypothetical protein ACR2H3_05845 [Acidimicrobiales bacterium]
MTDPVLAQRARMARLASFGQRAGYGLYAIAMLGFLAGFFASFSGAIAWLVIAALVMGSLFLAPSIVLGYAVKAAARDDRERGGAAPRSH